MNLLSEKISRLGCLGVIIEGKLSIYLNRGVLPGGDNFARIGLCFDVVLGRHVVIMFPIEDDKDIPVELQNIGFFSLELQSCPSLAGFAWQCVHAGVLVEQTLQLRLVGREHMGHGCIVESPGKVQFQ